MSSHEIGKAGATVFNAEGNLLVRLKHGDVIVEGTPDDNRALADSFQREAERLHTYASKMLGADDEPVQA